MPNEDALRLAGRTLRALAESTPEDTRQLPAWYERAREFEAVLHSDAALSDAIPHFVWHYLADADIRARDLAYRADQQVAILEIIIALETGRAPECAVVTPSRSQPVSETTIRVLAGSWLLSAFLWLASVLSKPWFEPPYLRIRQFGFIVTSTICLVSLLWLVVVFFRERPPRATIIASSLMALASTVALSLLMLMCYTP
jgi:hypothetical protein